MAEAGAYYSYIDHCIGSIFCICDAGTFHEHGEAYIEEFIPDGTFPSAQCCFVCSILCSTCYTAVFYPADTAGHCITGNRTTYLSEIFLFLKIFKKYEDALDTKADEEADNESEDLGIFAGSESIEQMSENKDSKGGNETK